MVVLSRSRRKNKRRGAILVLGAIASVLMVAFMAFAVDLGYLFVARTELQRSADAAAIASAWRLLDESRFGGDEAFAAVQTAARNAAAQYAGSNDVCNTSPRIDMNVENHPNGDVVFGRLMEGGNMSTYGNPAKHNAVRVLVRRSGERNGEVPLFFARFLGFDSSEVTAQATATFGDGVTGFRPTERTGNTTLIPFAIQVNYWEQFLVGAEGTGDDVWEIDPETDSVWRGSDGIREITIYPNATGSSGNFGTLEIGNPNNGVGELSDQIANGISKADLAYQGGELGLGPCNGDPGISGGIKHGLRDAVGKARTIALYDTVSGGGNNSVYNIVGFTGIRVMDYWLDGEKANDELDYRVVVQAAVVIDDSAVSGSGRSYGVYQPVVLAQ
jgi:Flp pilus assembly protein TadG